MADSTPNLRLPLIRSQQAQKEVTHAEGLVLIDAIVQLSVLSRAVTAPPAAPAEGQRWIVPAGASGVWAAHAGHVAAWYQGWRYFVPQPGWFAWASDESRLLVWTGAEWRAGLPNKVSDLLDVDIPAPPTDGQVLRWTTAGGGRWRAKDISLPELADVSDTPGTAGQVLVHDGSLWVPRTLSLAGASGDVVIASPADRDLLRYDVASGKWKNAQVKLRSLADVCDVAPADGNALVWSDALGQWAPAAVAGSGGGGGSGAPDAFVIFSGSNLNVGAEGTDWRFGIRSSKNVASVVRTNVGYYTVYFQNPMKNANYVAVFGGGFGGYPGDGQSPVTDATKGIVSEGPRTNASVTRSTTFLCISTTFQNGSSTTAQYDLGRISVVIYQQ